MNERNFNIFNSRKYRKERGAIHAVPVPTNPTNNLIHVHPPRLTNNFILWQMQWRSFYSIDLGLNSWYDGFRESAFGQNPLNCFRKQFFILENSVIFSTHTCVWFLKTTPPPLNSLWNRGRLNIELLICTNKGWSNVMAWPWSFIIVFPTYFVVRELWVSWHMTFFVEFSKSQS